jgi:flagellar basal body-associated protein FliL
MKKVMLISIVALAVIAAAAVILIGVFYGQQEKNQQSEGAPDVKFITFEAEKKEIAVGESTTVLINVRGSEDKVINDTRIVITI